MNNYNWALGNFGGCMYCSYVKYVLFRELRHKEIFHVLIIASCSILKALVTG